MGGIIYPLGVTGVYRIYPSSHKPRLHPYPGFKSTQVPQASAGARRIYPSDVRPQVQGDWLACFLFPVGNPKQASDWLLFGFREHGPRLLEHG